MTRKIGVAMAAYNTEQWIGEAIRSILSQTHARLRLLVLDDGSTDHTIEAVKPFLRDRRVELLAQEHTGCPGAKARCIDLLLEDQSVEYLALMDSDDVCSPKRLELQMQRLGHCDISYTTYGWIDAAGSYLRTMAPRKANATAVCRREWYERVGGWNLDGPYWGSDSRTLDKMRALGASEDVLAEDLYLQRRHPGQTTERRKRAR